MCRETDLKIMGGGVGTHIFINLFFLEKKYFMPFIGSVCPKYMLLFFFGINRFNLFFLIKHHVHGWLGKIAEGETNKEKSRVS